MFGLTIAESLPLHYDVTIVARDMPGDADTLDWASPWCVPKLLTGSEVADASPGRAQGGEVEREQVRRRSRS